VRAYVGCHATTLLALRAAGQTEKRTRVYSNTAIRRLTQRRRSLRAFHEENRDDRSARSVRRVVNNSAIRPHDAERFLEARFGEQRRFAQKIFMLGEGSPPRGVKPKVGEVKTAVTAEYARTRRVVLHERDSPTIHTLREGDEMNGAMRGKFEHP